MNAKELSAQAYRHYQAGDSAKAEDLCRRALSSQPRHAEAVYLLGVIAHDRQQMGKATELFIRASELSPGNAVFLNALGEAQFTLGQTVEAEKSIRDAIRSNPSYARAHNNLGRLLHARADAEAAGQSFSEAIRLNPNYATAHNNLGAVLQSMEQIEPAMPHFRQAIALKKDYPEAHFNLGSALLSLGDPTAAVQQLHEAIRLRPGYVRAYGLLGQALVNMGQVAASEAPLRKAAQLARQDPAGYAQLADVLVLLKKHEEALELLNQALRLKPDDAACFAKRFHVKDEICDWTDRNSELERLWTDAKRELEEGRASHVSPVHAMSLPWSADRQLAIARAHAAAYEKAAARAPGRPPTNVSMSGRLKIGYLSRDFYDHPVAHQMQSVFALHDRSRFEIHAYSFGPDDRSSYRKQIEQGCEHFDDVERLSVAQTYERIRNDGIQILVDLMGYTGLARTACVAQRPAPIQVNWLGYSGTMGANFIDYIIGDPSTTPEELSNAYSEKIVRLPHTFMPTSRQEIAESAGPRSTHHLPDDAFVFCCFNNAYKIDPELFATWMTLLRDVADSVLWLSVNLPLARENLRAAAREHGIDPTRLVFAEHVRSKGEHLARYRLADLFLDTRFYNAHATACDALWADLPLLTCPGDTFASRVAMSLLKTAGLRELIASDLADYQRIALELANDRLRLQPLRQKLQFGRIESPLFDTQRFVRSLEFAFEKMWKIHASGDPPQLIEIDESTNNPRTTTSN